MLLIAPTEPPKLRALGKVSSQPELHGVDVLWYAHGQRWGVQRKEVKDLIASLEDGRLTRERAMMGRVDHAVLMIEGRMQWTGDGMLMGGKSTGGFGRDYRYSEIMGRVWGMAAEGVWIVQTGGLEETCRAVEVLEKWSRKDKHQSLRSREPLVSTWGRPRSREFAIYMLTGLPGVGPEIAERIVGRFGRLPWRWDVTREELLAVEGVGKKKVEMMMHALSVEDDGGFL